jgi:hypothetical protein
MGFGYIRRRCTSNAKHSSATSLGRERDRPVHFSIRRKRWRTVFGWQVSTSAAPPTDASLSCHTRNVSKSISRSSSGRSVKGFRAARTDLTIASGALTAAVARMEPSNTATEDVESVGPRNITRATCRACGVSRRSPKAALTPTRAVVVRDMRATTTSSLWSELTWDDSDLHIRLPPPGRKDVQAAQLRFDLAQRLITYGRSLGGGDHKRTIDRQPKTAGDVPQAPLVERSSLK